MKIAVLFDGVGMARLGLEQAGHDCTGFEINPLACYLGHYVGSGKVIHTDALTVDLSDFDAVWASPPCQWRSVARTNGLPQSQYAGEQDLTKWSLNLPHEVLWVENVMVYGKGKNNWGTKYNASQFLKHPIQNRNRIVGGRYPTPVLHQNQQGCLSSHHGHRV